MRACERVCMCACVRTKRGVGTKAGALLVCPSTLKVSPRTNCFNCIWRMCLFLSVCQDALNYAGRTHRSLRRIRIFFFFSVSVFLLRQIQTWPFRTSPDLLWWVWKPWNGSSSGCCCCCKKRFGNHSRCFGSPIEFDSGSRVSLQIFDEAFCFIELSGSTIPVFKRFRPTSFSRDYFSEIIHFILFNFPGGIS